MYLLLPLALLLSQPAAAGVCDDVRWKMHEDSDGHKVRWKHCKSRNQYHDSGHTTHVVFENPYERSTIALTFKVRTSLGKELQWERKLSPGEDVFYTIDSDGLKYLIEIDPA